MDLSALFEPRPRLDRFEDLRAELRAIRFGDKAMSVFSFGRSDVGTTGYDEAVSAALDLGLMIAQYPENINLGNSSYEQLYLFVLRPDQGWRLPAYLATRRIIREYEWSDGAEFLESYLLGYSEEDISTWMARFHNSRVNWNGITIYLLLIDADLKAARELGMRCLDPRSASEGITAFASRQKGLIRNDAAKLIPEGLVLVRAAVSLEFFKELFGPSKDWGDADIISSTVTPNRIRSLNATLGSNFEVFESGCWR